ncbi:threonyl-tRNA synthetase [Thermosipho melanesiensis]|uniref:Threonine--tRNA ligase n=2 Tax=Thermosipho melanesiensis TaxID=46541 RepID=A6LMM5_THEM4|nr:threonine--tRNA ligase [Thermosipho melanesiensis]ABR31176.1 threonyl-tRNA synthetase [Thermosipho melanesiensis BI429]APT74265.1 threonyl-tRNA synthetase [Thermosipho melanesiensis]OOC36204.1 threonyl-tRNA synthetase [Thermosipho melanesiensis]OOC37022.1 threonyl-tRNA synthetase [Thermosipho melanesiensis]OOC37774.1 threonyl-tRNA synthetase [Thermosipho melanesiensis]
MKIKFPDGNVKEFEKGITPGEIAKSISEGLYRNAVGAIVDNILWDLNRPINFDCSLKIVTKKDKEAPEFFRHTMAHILAQAVMRIYGEENVRLGIGPTIENGFYYDFEILNGTIKEEDLENIEKEMKKIIKEDLPIERFELPKDEAIDMMNKKGQIYKVELINEINDEKVSFYKQGEFVDLCRGPHLPRTGMIKHFKLLSASGAYWRGSEKNPMLQRIYGTAFATKEELENYLKMLEEAKKRDHRKLGPKLGLFFINTDVAAGMPIFLPKGTIILNELMAFSRSLHEEYGYTEVMTPLVMNVKLWYQSGHWDHYKENMYFTEKEEVEYAIKPMNCPGHILIYKNNVVSYRDLPIRLFEFGKVHRYERSGVLHGLLRVRAFTQDDAHIFCRQDQIEEEVSKVVKLIDQLYKPFGFSYRATLSTMPEDHMGDEETWEKATNALRKVLEDIKLEFEVAEGEGAFYGPKVDFHVRDSLGREWQCATIQLDFQMPERFELTYVDKDGIEKRPVMIHTAKYGSLERFFGILIEHFAGAFPLWLSPIQVVVLPVSDKYVSYARKIYSILMENGVRVSVDDRNETLGYKIREAQINKIPYMIIVGEREEESGKISIRSRDGVEQKDIAVEEFLDLLSVSIKERR